MTKRIRARLDKLETPALKASGLDLTIGTLITKELDEPTGPTLFPQVSDLREWDMKLLERYPMFYAPFCDHCCLCTFGKCDLTAGKHGACGIDTAGQQGRIILLACLIGAACHTGHARHLLHFLERKMGSLDKPIFIGEGIEVEAPHMRLLTGLKPETIADLKEALEYCEEQIVQGMAATHTGQEGSAYDFESKAMHIGMIDHLGMEIADIAQLVAYDQFPKADPNAPLVEIGAGVFDLKKPTVLLIGHNIAAGGEIIEYLEDTGQLEEIEVGGICCTAFDVTRRNPAAKIVGPISKQIKFVRAGIPDVVVVDEQCINVGIHKEAAKIGAPFIATNSKASFGLKNLTEEDPDRIVEILASGELPGALILDELKVGEVAVKLAKIIAPKRAKRKVIPSEEEFAQIVKDCNQCGRCRRACPQDLHIRDAMKAAKGGDLEPLAQLHDYCVGCARCEEACDRNIPILSLIEKAAERKVKTEKYTVRTGRGAVSDVEIRGVGSDLVLGNIPGAIALVGCANYPETNLDLSQMAKEFLDRNFIVVASGCSAMDISMWRDENGETIWEAYPGDFDKGAICNVGSCVANSHITGAVIKVANIFARRPLKGNYEEIADYILHRVGAVGMAWGAYSQKAAAIATGCNRLGIPVVVGPHGSKYRRSYMGNREDASKWQVYNARTGDQVYIGPAPEHLIYPAETLEEAMPLMAKLCIRANDTSKGRQIKVAHYVDLTRKYIGIDMPPDIHYYIRNENDIPVTLDADIREYLKQIPDWKPIDIPDPTLLKRLVRRPKD
ncbi:MAG: CO dehydrogenase/acetyl-CoA synthase complex subunit alpha [Candidatus Hodarchaeota archaeon]